MCKRLIRKLLLVTLLSLCWLLPQAGLCSAAEPETVTMSISDYQSLKTELQQLKLNNEKQQKLYRQLKEQLEASEKQQNLSSQDWMQLRQQLTEARLKVQQLETLCTTLEQQLTKAEQSSLTAQNELAIANQSLSELSKAIKSERRAAQRRELALKGVIVGLVVYGLTK